MTRLAIAYVLVLASCDTVAVRPSPSEEAPRAEPASELDARACDSLSRGECMRALHCTLEATSGRSYVCRDARGDCEIGLRQIDEDRDRCADRVGCAWSEGSCYCACRGAGSTRVPDGDEAQVCDCECGGGAPPGCRAR